MGLCSGMPCHNVTRGVVLYECMCHSFDQTHFAFVNVMCLSLLCVKVLEKDKAYLGLYQFSASGTTYLSSLSLW